MNYKVLTIPPFDKQLRRLSKKYPSLKSEIKSLIDLLESEPRQGTPLGKNCYKIRISIASKGKGASGGGRIITHLHFDAKNILLLTIYDKSEKQNISDKELSLLLSDIDLVKKK